jgi:hypothetical protein
MPPGSAQRIAFMHIPKTAGSSVVHAFEQALGAEHCSTLVPPITDAHFAEHRFISGHQMLFSITPNAFRFTFLREPLAQLVSHLRWLDHYNLPQFRAQALRLSAPVRHVIVRIGETDLTSPHAIDEFFDWLPQTAPVKLRNVQCEVLTRRGAQPQPSDPEALAQAAIDNLALLDFIGTVAHLHLDLARLFAMLRIKGAPRLTHENSASAERQIDLTNPDIRAVLAKHMQADLLLYQHVTEQIARGRTLGRGN